MMKMLYELGKKRLRTNDTYWELRSLKIRDHFATKTAVMIK